MGVVFHLNTEMTVTFRVFKKASSNNKVTIYLGRRDFVDHVTGSDPVDVHHFGHAYHDGPHCHDKKDYQCHKTPKQQNHEECFVDYDIVVDVTYIEECEYVVITHCAEEHEQVYHNP